MIKFYLMDQDGKEPPLLGMWITKENVAQLMEGKPIHFELPGMIKVILAYNESIEEAHAAIEKLFGTKLPGLDGSVKTPGSQ